MSLLHFVRVLKVFGRFLCVFSRLQRRQRWQPKHETELASAH